MSVFVCVCTVIKEEYYILFKIKYIALAEGGFNISFMPINFIEVIHFIIYLLEVTIDASFFFLFPISIIPYLVPHTFFSLQETENKNSVVGSNLGQSQKNSVRSVFTVLFSKTTWYFQMTSVPYPEFQKLGLAMEFMEIYILEGVRLEKAAVNS